MYHPTTRLLTVLELLQSHGQMSGTEIAACLEVEVRTVRRYIMMLQDMGIPIEAEMGRHGGYSLRPGFKLPPMMFTNDEALAVVLGLLVVRYFGISVALCSVEGAMAKLYRALPHALREQTQVLQSALIVSLNAPDQQVAVLVLARLGQAVHDKQQAAIDYRREDEQTRRVVDPYGLVYFDGAWYLVGYCHLRTEIRVFRLDRIVHVELRAERFTPPEDFDSAAYLQHSIATMPDQWNIEVVLKTTLDHAARALPPGLGMLEQCPAGVMLRSSVKDLDWLARYLAGLGFPVVVCQPPELRTAFQRLATEIAQFATAEI